MKTTRLAVAAAAALAVGAAAIVQAAPSGALKHVNTLESASLSNGTDAAIARDGKNVYGGGYAGDSLGVFSRNANTGALTFVEEEDGNGLGSPEGIGVAPNGNNVYVAGNTSDTVHSYSRAANGTLSFLSAVEDGVNGADGLDGAYGLAVARGGSHVYVAGSDDDAITLLQRGAGGALEWEDAFINGSEGISDMAEPRGVAVSPDGKSVYAVTADSGSIVTFKRFLATGQLDFVESVNITDTSHAVTVAPDGRQVYVGGNNGVRTYKRNVITGALSLLGLTDEVTSVRGLAAAPAGDNVYATAGSAKDIATLATRAKGKLKFVEVDVNDELSGPNGVAASTDGRHVFAVGGAVGDGAIGAYSRQPKLALKGKKKQKGSKLAVKAECSADCKVVITGKGVKKASKQLKAGKPKRVRIRFKGTPPRRGKVLLKGKAKAGNRTAADKMKVRLK